MLARPPAAYRPSVVRAAVRGATTGIGTYLVLLALIFVVVPVALVGGFLAAFAVIGFVLAHAGTGTP